MILVLLMYLTFGCELFCNRGPNVRYATLAVKVAPRRPYRRLSGASRLGPTVMLVNSWAGSGGDAFPYLFRRADLGPIIGTRTWGGLIGISGNFDLVDGGGVTVPTLALYTPEREWMLEGHGLEPDIEVVDDPSIMTTGRDPQLERAIAEVLRLLEENPFPTTTAPEPGDRTAKP